MKTKKLLRSAARALIAVREKKKPIQPVPIAPVDVPILTLVPAPAPEPKPEPKKETPEELIERKAYRRRIRGKLLEAVAREDMYVLRRRKEALQEDLELGLIDEDQVDMLYNEFKDELLNDVIIKNNNQRR